VTCFEGWLVFAAENRLFGEKISTESLLTKTGMKKGNRVAVALLFSHLNTLWQIRRNNLQNGPKFSYENFGRDKGRGTRDKKRLSWDSGIGGLWVGQSLEEMRFEALARVFGGDEKGKMGRAAVKNRHESNFITHVICMACQ
jgi:hypothetical protein